MLFSQISRTLLQELQKNLPGSVSELPTEELRLLVENCLQKLDLVPRAEFDAQQAVLARTRLRLEQLEQELARLAAALSPADPDLKP